MAEEVEVGAGAAAVEWTVKSQCNHSFKEAWYWATSQGVVFEGLADDEFTWRLHRRGCAITPEMEQPSVVGASIADGIRSHMQRFGIGMWSMYDSRGRAIMNGCGDSYTNPNLHSCSSVAVAVPAAESAAGAAAVSATAVGSAGDGYGAGGVPCQHARVCLARGLELRLSLGRSPWTVLGRDFGRRVCRQAPGVESR